MVPEGHGVKVKCIVELRDNAPFELGVPGRLSGLIFVTLCTSIFFMNDVAVMSSFETVIPIWIIA